MDRCDVPGLDDRPAGRRRPGRAAFRPAGPSRHRPPRSARPGFGWPPGGPLEPWPRRPRWCRRADRGPSPEVGQRASPFRRWAALRGQGGGRDRGTGRQHEGAASGAVRGPATGPRPSRCPHPGRRPGPHPLGQRRPHLGGQRPPAGFRLSRCRGPAAGHRRPERGCRQPR